MALFWSQARQNGIQICPPSRTQIEEPATRLSTPYQAKKTLDRNIPRTAGLFYCSRYFFASVIMSSQFTPTVTALVPQPDCDIEELCKPTLVGVIIVADRQTKSFRIPKFMLCSVSLYFHKLFYNNNFVESTTQAFSPVTIRGDIPIWAFITFVQWLYTQRLILNDTVHGPLDDLLGYGNLNDPSTWPYATLFVLYAMADRLDVLTLRRLIIEQVQIKMNGKTPQAPLPSFPDMLLLQDITPYSSQLRRYIFFRLRALPNYREIRDQYLCRFSPYTPSCSYLTVTTEMKNSYDEFLADLKYAHDAKAGQVGCFNCGLDANMSDREGPCDRHHRLEATSMRNTRKAWCMFHEHENDAEMAICEFRLESCPDRIEGSPWPYQIAADEY